MVYLGKCVSSRSVGWQRKRKVDTVKDWLKKKSGFGCQASEENEYDRREWQVFVRVNAWGFSLVDEPMILTCHSCGLPRLYETFEG